MSLERKRLLVVDSGSEDARGYILHRARALGLQVVVAGASLTWEKAYGVAGITVDLTRPDAVLKAVVDVHAREPFDGVFTYSERYVLLAARIAERLGLPGPSVAAAALTRSKEQLATVLAAAAVPVPNSIPVVTEADLVAAIKAIGYPAIVKPANGFESRGVIHLPSPESLPEALELMRSFRLDGSPPALYLVQEYIDGPEVSIEALVYDGVCYPLMVTEKHLGPLPYFEEIGHAVPCPLAPELRTELFDLVRKAVKGAGLDRCAIHAEVRRSGKGPKLIEMACRLGGDFIPYLVYLATGIDMVAGALKIALGEPPDLTERRQRGAALRFVVPPRGGTIREIAGWPSVTGTDGVHLAKLTAQPGDRVDLPPRAYCTRVGAVIMTAPSVQVVKERMDAAFNELRFEMA